MKIVTLPERKAREAARRTAAASAVMDRLRDYVREAGSGRFIVFGSAATGAMRYGSDLDILIDFPEQSKSAAWRVVEDICAEWNLPVDILSTATTSQAFVDKIMAGPVRIIG